MTADDSRSGLSRTIVSAAQRSARSNLDDIRPETPLRDMTVLRRIEAVIRWGLRCTTTGPGRRTILRRALFTLAGVVTPVIAADISGERYLVSTRDRAIGAITFSEGGLDLAIMEYALGLIESSAGHSLRGRTFVDVGANIGTATIPAIERFGAANAVAVEPSTENYKLLRCNIISNDLADRVATVKAALSNTVGTGLLELGDSNWGDHRIRSASSSVSNLYGESARDVNEVDIVTFDSLVEARTINISSLGVVWIDTQGHEAQVLAGARTLLDSDVPVVIEYWPYGLRRADGLERLREIVEHRYRTVVDLRASVSKQLLVDFPASSIRRLEEIYDGTSYTDLLLLK